MPRPAESLERRAAQITISAFFAGPECSPFHLSPLLGQDLRPKLRTISEITES